MEPFEPKTRHYYAEIRRYNRILKEFPGNSRVLQFRAAHRFRHGDWKKAAEAYEDYLKVKPDNYEIWGILGMMCVHGRMPEKAVAACSRAIELNPDLANHYMHRAWAYRQLKQWDASIADYTRAMEMDRKRRNTMHSTLYRGQLYMEMGEYEKAAEDFSMAIGKSRFWSTLYAWRSKAYKKMKQYEKIIENANAFMDVNGYPDTYFLNQRAYAFKKLGQKEKAESDLALIKRLNEETQKENEAREEQQAKEIEKSDDAHAKAIREWNASIQKHTEAIEADKNDAQAYYKRGLAYVENCEWRKALKDFNNVIRLDRKYAAAYFNRAECYNRIGQLTKSLNDYAMAISLNPNMTGAYKKRSHIHNALGDTEKEIADIEKVLELSPKEPFMIQMLGELCEKTGNYERAVNLMNIEFSEKPVMVDSLDLWFSKMRGYYQAPRIKKLTDALARDPENAALYFLRGETYDDDSQFEKAIADYTKAISLKQDLLIAYYYRALANAVLSDFHKAQYSHTQDNSQALEAYSKYEQIYEAMIADLLKVTQLDNTIAFIHRELGGLYVITGKYELAIDSLNKALAIDPECLFTHEERAKAYTGIKEYQKAVDDLIWEEQKHSLGLSDSKAELRADIYCKMGELSKAIADYDMIIEHKSKWDIYRSSLARNFEKRGKCYQKLGDNAKAAADFDKAEKLREKDW